MQIPKEDIRKRILSVARKEFATKGVRSTSMRSIAAEAGIAVGNIYRYFDSKDDMFVAVCQPLLYELDNYAQQENSPYYQTLDVFTPGFYQESMADGFLSLVGKYRTEFRLLLFEATGTPLEDYFERYAVKQAEVGRQYLAVMKEKYPQININVSPYFIRLNCIIWFYVLRIIIQNEEMTKDDIKQLIGDYVNYGTGGWKMLFNV